MLMAGIKAGMNGGPGIRCIYSLQVTHYRYSPAEIVENAVKITAGLSSQGPGVGESQLIIFI